MEAWKFGHKLFSFRREDSNWSLLRMGTFLHSPHICPDLVEVHGRKSWCPQQRPWRVKHTPRSRAACAMSSASHGLRSSGQGCQDHYGNCEPGLANERVPGTIRSSGEVAKTHEADRRSHRVEQRGPREFATVRYLTDGERECCFRSQIQNLLPQ